MKLKLGLGLLVLTATLVTAIMAVPGLRDNLLGVHLAYRFPTGTTDVGAWISLQEAEVLSGVGDTSPVELSEPQELKVVLKEEPMGSVTDRQYSYRFEEMRAEQFGAGESIARKLAGSRATIRLGPNGLVQGLTVSTQSRSLFLHEGVLGPWLECLWPPLAPGTVKPEGGGWSAVQTIQVPARVAGQTVVLEHRVTLRLKRIVEDGGRRLAEISWTGSVAAQPPHTAKGTVAGTALFDLETGRVLAGDCDVDQELSLQFGEVVAGSEEARLRRRQKFRARLYLVLNPNAR